jgi:hypothetical protein
MASNALVQTRIDADVKEKGHSCSGKHGSDGVRRRADPADAHTEVVCGTGVIPSFCMIIPAETMWRVST